MNPEWLRYYIAAKLTAKVEDIDFNPEDFIARVNSDLIGKYVNIASRAAGFISKKFDGKLADRLGRPTPTRSLKRLRDAGAGDRSAVRRPRIRQGAARDDGRWPTRSMQYVDANKPWELAKKPEQAARAAGCLQPADRGFPHADHLPEAGAAGRWRARSRRCSMSSRCSGAMPARRCPTATASTPMRT